MPTDVAPFRPENLRDKVTDRIRTSFVDLIPEDAWRSMVEEQIRYFTSGSNQRSDHRRTSPLQDMIHDEIQTRFKEKIKAYLDSPEMQERWSQADGSYGPGKALEEILTSLVPQIIVAQYQSSAAAIIQRIKQSMQGY